MENKKLEPLEKPTFDLEPGDSFYYRDRWWKVEATKPIEGDRTLIMCFDLKDPENLHIFRLRDYWLSVLP